MSAAEVTAKALDLMSARPGAATLADTLLHLDDVADVATLHDLLTPSPREATPR